MGKWLYLLYKDVEEGHFAGERLFVGSRFAVGMQLHRVEDAEVFDAEQVLSFFEVHSDLKFIRLIDYKEPVSSKWWIKQMERFNVRTK